MKQTVEFKKDMEEKIIPSVKRMIEKEEKHLIHLKEMKDKIEKKLFFGILTNALSGNIINEYISESEKMLVHMNQRLNEYIEYIK